MGNEKGCHKNATERRTCEKQVWRSFFLVSLDVEINPRFYRGIVKRAELQQKWRGECQAERL